MSEWISVKEKLPSPMSNVLVWFSGLYNEHKIAFFSGKDFYPNNISDEFLTRWITHWMPLPNPPNPPK